MASNPRYAGNDPKRNAIREFKQLQEFKKRNPGAFAPPPIPEGNNAGINYLNRRNMFKQNRVGDMPVRPEINAVDRDHARREEKKQQRRQSGEV
jgi:hypothetical protein